MEEAVELPIREIDTSSIQQQMARNKELLQVKLMVRRPISQLIEQGIMPPLRQSPVLYEQTKRLERARTEDYLKHKISNRPNRQQLIEHHILEDTNISPILIAKQQQLKKAKLADSLNERLSHRPGPLELINSGILLPSNLQVGQAAAVKQAVNSIEFKPTSLGETIKYPQPSFLILKKDQPVHSSNSLINKVNSKPQSLNNHQKSIKSCNNYHFDHHCNSLGKGSNNNHHSIDNTGLIEALGGRSMDSETTNGVVSVNKVAELDADEDENDDSNHTCSSSYSSCSLNDSEECSITNSLDNTNLNETVELSNDSPNTNQRTSPDNGQLLNNGKQQSSCNQQTNKIQPTNPQSNQLISINNNQSKSCTNKLLSNNCGSLKDKKDLFNRSKKNKIKLQNKNKIIKFHEYKGPNAIKQSSTFNDCSRTETAYELLLQQQQLYLQLELEMQQKQQHLSNQQMANQRIQKESQDKKESSLNSSMNGKNLSNKTIQDNSNNSEPNSPMQIGKEGSQSPSNLLISEKDEQIINTPIVNTSMVNTTMINNSSLINTSPINTSLINRTSIIPVTMKSNSPSNSPTSNVKTEPTTMIDNQIDLNKIEEMKVNNLKLELKKYNLPVSGSKTTLIERLKNYISKSRLQMSIESMDVDTPLTQKISSPISNICSNSPVTSSNTNLTNANLLLNNSNHFQQQSPVSVTSAQNFYTNTISSTPVTTFATLTAVQDNLQPTSTNLIGATTAFLAQSPPILKTTPFNSFNTTTATSFVPASNKTNPLNKTQTSLTNLKQDTTILQNNKPRRISEPQLQHIQLHFTNPFLQFATTTTNQSPLNTTSLTNNSAQQIHFLSTPALNTNDLHLFTQPLINNRIIQSNSANTVNQPTAWTLQPTTNNFPQLFFYPSSLVNNSTNLMTSLNSGLSNVTSTNNGLNNVNNGLTNGIKMANNQLKTESTSSSNSPDSEQTSTNQKNTTKLKCSKNSKQSNKANKNSTIKTSESNRKISILNNLSNKCSKNNSNENNVNNQMNNVLSNQTTNSNVKNVNQTTNNLLAKYSVDEQKVNYTGNDSLEKKNETNYTILEQNQMNSYLMSTSNYLSNVNNSTILIDKPPPNYEEATKSKKKNISVSNEQNNVNCTKTFINATNSHLTFTSALNRSSSNSCFSSDELKNNNVIQCMNSQNANYYSSKTSESIEQTNNYESNKQRIAANLINSVNIGNSSTNVADKTNHFHLRTQSSSLEFSNGLVNVEDKNSVRTSERKQERCFEQNLEDNHLTENKFYSTNSMNEYSYQSYGLMNGINNYQCNNLLPEVNMMINLNNNMNCMNNTNCITNKQEIDFALDFDQLMEDLTDFVDFDSNHSKNSQTKLQDMEIDQTITDRLTVNTNFDQFTEQSLHTPTLPDQQEHEQQILNHLIETNQSNSMIFDTPFTLHEDYTHVL